MSQISCPLISTTHKRSARPPTSHYLINGGSLHLKDQVPLYVLWKLLQDLTTGIHNTAFYQKNKIQSQKNTQQTVEFCM